MTSINAKSVQREINQNKTRPVKVPKGDYRQHMKNPYIEKYNNGEFKNEFYQSYSPMFIAWVYISNIVLFLIPALVLHAPLILIKTVYFVTFGESLVIASEGTYLLLIYGAPLLLALRRIHRIMAYYNVMSLNGRRTINALQTHSMNVQSPNAVRELAVMDHTRMKLNKTHLFQSAMEATIDKQELGEYADSIENKTNEHFAAKAIADRKQKENGGANEYDAMVRRYKNRTTPAMREIIKMVQN